jgi:hypothetical protein
MHNFLAWHMIKELLTRNPKGLHEAGSVKKAGSFFFFPPFFPFFGMYGKN